MKKVSYDVRFNRLNYTPDDGEDVIEWDIAGEKLASIQKLISILEGTDMDIVYSSKPEKHMADVAISILQSLRGVLLEAEKVLMISNGNSEVADLILNAETSELIGESGLTKDEYLEVSGAIASIMTWAEGNATLADSRVVKLKEIIMKGYEV